MKTSSYVLTISSIVFGLLSIIAGILLINGGLLRSSEFGLSLFISLIVATLVLAGFQIFNQAKAARIKAARTKETISELKLTQEQLALIREQAISNARQLKLTESQAQLLADALISNLVADQAERDKGVISSKENDE